MNSPTIQDDASEVVSQTSSTKPFMYVAAAVLAFTVAVFGLGFFGSETGDGTNTEQGFTLLDCPLTEEMARTGHMNCQNLDINGDQR